MQKHFRAHELAKILGISKSTVWSWTKLGRLPKPVKLSPRTTVWREEDVLAALSAIEREQKAQ